MAKLKISSEKVEKYDAIREDFFKQLLDQNKLGKHFEDLLEHAMYLIKLKDILQEDIDDKGIRMKVQTGNGFKKDEDNKSVEKLLKVSAQLMKVLDDLGLKESLALDPKEDDPDEGLL